MHSPRSLRGRRNIVRVIVKDSARGKCVGAGKFACLEVSVEWYRDDFLFRDHRSSLDIPRHAMLGLILLMGFAVICVPRQVHLRIVWQAVLDTVVVPTLAILDQVTVKTSGCCTLSNRRPSLSRLNDQDGAVARTFPVVKLTLWYYDALQVRGGSELGLYAIEEVLRLTFAL